MAGSKLRKAQKAQQAATQPDGIRIVIALITSIVSMPILVLFLLGLIILVICTGGAAMDQNAEPDPGASGADSSSGPDEGSDPDGTGVHSECNRRRAALAERGQTQPRGSAANRREREHREHDQDERDLVVDGRRQLEAEQGSAGNREAFGSSRQRREREQKQGNEPGEEPRR